MDLDGHLIALQGLETLHEVSYRHAGFRWAGAHDLDLSLLAVAISLCKVNAKLDNTNWAQDYRAVRSLLPTAHLLFSISGRSIPERPAMQA